MDLKEMALKRKVQKVQECRNPLQYAEYPKKQAIPHFAARGAQNNMRHVTSHICFRDKNLKDSRSGQPYPHMGGGHNFIISTGRSF